jgi:hypothetical protein
MGVPEKTPAVANTRTTTPAGMVLPAAAVRFGLSSGGESSSMETLGCRAVATTVVMAKPTVPYPLLAVTVVFRKEASGWRVVARKPALA